jgi:hypothetical protein
MTSVPMSEFVDFVLTSGTGKLTAVRYVKQHLYDRGADFYKPLRESIVDAHEKGLDVPAALADYLTTVVDPRERRIFPKVVKGYGKFLRGQKMTWFEPPMRDYPVGPLSVRVNPEVGLLIGGKPHAIKLYFRGDPLAPQRAMVVNELLHGAFSATWPGTVCAVLDVRRARLYPYRPKSEMGALLRAEAASFASLYAVL